jgi:predicted nucleic-acid-binding Zn-ribbon protein
MNVNGYPLKCSHCGGKDFSFRKALLNTTGMTFLDLDWLNKSADVFSCSSCGRLEWFLDATVTEEEGHSPYDCPRCGFFVSESVAVCPNCGNPSHRR